MAGLVDLGVFVESREEVVVVLLGRGRGADRGAGCARAGASTEGIPLFRCAELSFI